MITHKNIHKNNRLIGVYASEAALAAAVPENTPKADDFYFNTTENTLKVYSGSAWQTVAGPPASTAVGLSKGMVACQTLASAQLEALFDTNAHNLFAVKAGDIILSVEVDVSIATGGTGTLDIGLDAAVLGTTADVDALLDGANLNAAGKYRSSDTVTDATAHTYSGAKSDIGPFVVIADGFVTCEMVSGTTQVAGNFVGSVQMKYIPA
jgi:hypothetical protein